MIRILHVVSSLNINAGMMSVIMNYYRNIDRNKVQFDFLYFAKIKDNHQEEIEKLGGRTFYMPHRSLKPSDQRELNRFFREHEGEFIAVHCHPIWASIVVARAAKKNGVRHVIQHAHSTKFSEKKISAVRNQFLMLFVGLFATDFIACNDDANYLFGKRRAQSGNVFILPNSIQVENYAFDSELRESIRKEYGVKPDTMVIGNVGRLSVEKNQRFIVEVYNQIRQKNPDSKLVIVGEGNYRKGVEDKIKELGLENEVLMTGRRYDIKAILSGFDLFIMPSLFEGTPVSALEARTSGLPCLLSDTITKSVDMDGMRYLSLNESAERWAEEAVNFVREWKTHDRCDYSEIEKHGFAIKKNSKLLENYYLNMA